MPFAGHPTVGTAVLLGRLDGGSAREFVVEEGIGPVRCTVEPIDDGRGRARFALPQLPAAAGAAPDDATIAAALGLSTTDIGIDGLRPSRWSAGNPCTFVPVARLAAVADCRPDAGKIIAAFGNGIVYLFCRDCVEAGHDFHARMFAPAFGVPEDPATGSAAAAFAGVLAAHGGRKDGEHRVVIEQGYEMGRPSLMELAFVVQAGKLVSASVGGSAVIVTEGTIEA